MKFRILTFIFGLLLLASCGEYNKVLKNPDLEVKYSYAKNYFALGKFSRSATLLEDVVPMFKGSVHAEESLYLLAQSYYGMRDYMTASQYFASYYNTYPKGEYTELARYYSAYGLYLDSPDPRLDQTQTYQSIKQFQDFMEYYPQSERKAEAEMVQFELQEKLALKDLMAVRLYYNLGNYVVGYPFPGGNYSSCVISATGALRTYPYSKYREEFMYYSIRAKYDMALESVKDKKSLRYRDVIDEYYTYINDFPDGLYVKQIVKIFENSQKQIEDKQFLEQ
ncbi:outer membrane protein assembly factor BamD [Bacteroidales bacterium]|nr:outer membrane protein assembly factor BamD [Bacteroidales bacterium]